MKAAVAVVALLGLGAIHPAIAAPTPRGVLGCATFMERFEKAAVGHRASFERPLVITRGFLGGEDGLDVRVLSTPEGVEGTLKCKGDAFRRFEVRIGDPFTDALTAAFRDYQEASLAGAFGWEKPKVQTVLGAMSGDAAEYLRASVQRGDVSVSGKVEYHQGDALDLGVIWTNEDRTLIITTQDDS